MELDQILHMNEGEGENSYANNSTLQKEVILKTKPVLEQSLLDLYSSSNGFPDCIRFADMGCSSGPNSLLPTWEAIDSLDKICLRLNRRPPVLHAFLNDLPGSDFNTNFKSLPSFYERLKKEKGYEVGSSCFVAAAPGSFYGRLFPPNFLHFVYSSYSLHWLSQQPNKGLVSGSEEAEVQKTYQFESDFSSFLKFRSEELKPGGRIVLSFMFNNDNYHHTITEPTMMVLKDMISEGLIEESKLESWDSPFYPPSIDQVKQVVEREGSFGIHHLETFDVSWLVGFDDNNDNKGLDDKYARGKYLTRQVRAARESLMSDLFGRDAITEEFFNRLSIKVTDEFLEKGCGSYATLLISLVKN